MTKKHTSSKLKKAKLALVTTGLIVAAIAIGAWVYTSPFGRQIMATNQLQRTFAKENDLLGGPIASLGVSSTPKQQVQCIPDGRTHWRMTILCQVFKSYPYNADALAPAAQASYPANATKLEQLLQQDGWVNDSPQTLTGIINHAYLGGEDTVGVPFHKNIGDISCNLQINFMTLTGTIAAPGALNVNDFSCQRTFSAPFISPTTSPAKGP